MRILIILLSFYTFSCKNTSNKHLPDVSPTTKDTINSPSAIDQPDTGNLANNFREFRNALYVGDIEKTIPFVTLPLINSGNEIWYLVYQNRQDLIDKLPERLVPFSEKDFHKYYHKLFSKSFIQTLLKIKSDELFRTGAAESSDLKEGITSYKMYATFDKAAKMLTLNLSSETEMKEENGEAFDKVESNIIYEFQTIDNKKIKLKQVRLAG